MGSRIAAVGLAALVGLALPGCWPGRCGGALRGTPMVSFAGGHAPCTEGPACAELVGPEVGFHQKGDFARVDEPEQLIASAGLSGETWFLVDASGARIASSITPQQHSSAHSCASAVGFDLRPDAALEPGVYRLVLLVDRVNWPLLRQGVDLSSWEGERALIQFYRVEAPPESP